MIKEPEMFINDFCWIKDLGDFESGQAYENKPAKTLVCKKCKSKRFIVGTGSYITIIKCENCGYELCVHEG